MRTLAAILLAATASAVPLAQSRTATQAARGGWDALNAGKIQAAADTFEEALKDAPRDERLLLGAAVAAHLQGRSEDARRALVDLLAVNPAATAASLLLGEVLYRGGDIDGAVVCYEQALTYAPGQPQLTRRLVTWRKEAALHSGFGQRYGDHFAVLFEGSDDTELADRAVSMLESAYWRIGSALAAYPPDAITVVLYTREQFRDITSSPDWTGGAYDGRIRVPVQGARQNLREFERVLSHEFTHALVRSLAPRGLPVWLDEGLAVHFEGSEAPRTETRAPQPAAMLSFSRLERSFAGLDAREAAQAYAQSARAVQTLLDEAGAQAVVSLLSEVGAGASFRDAFERRVQTSYRDFQRRMDTPPTP